jgi:hypothetical protein
LSLNLRTGSDAVAPAIGALELTIAAAPETSPVAMNFLRFIVLFLSAGMLLIRVTAKSASSINHPRQIWKTWPDYRPPRKTAEKPEKTAPAKKQLRQDPI